MRRQAEIGNTATATVRPISPETRKSVLSSVSELTSRLMHCFSSEKRFG